MQRKKFLLVGGIVVIAVASLGYFYGPSFVKKLIGYNVPMVTQIPTTSGSALSFLKADGGIDVSIVAKDLNNPRVIVFDPKGRMVISEMSAGRVSVLVDADKDGIFEARTTLLDKLSSPHGLAFYKDDKGVNYLYVAETQRVMRYIYDVNAGKVSSLAGVNIDNLPADGKHVTRTIAFGPNYRTTDIVSGAIPGSKSRPKTLAPEKLYISVGSSCDVCEESTWKRAAILETDPTGSYLAEFAGGLRNSVFLAFHPKTKELWATEMGRDNLGDNLPPDEINIIKVAGAEDKFGAKRYGWPFCYGNKVKDTTFKPNTFQRTDIPQDCSQTQSPVIEIPAHSAPLGLAFVPIGKGWPKEWEGDLLVALHGSWNRTQPVGYKIVRYDLDADGHVISQNPVDFISGWLSGGKTYGRPVDLKFDVNGKLFISDDASGVVYRAKPGAR